MVYSPFFRPYFLGGGGVALGGSGPLDSDNELITAQLEVGSLSPRHRKAVLNFHPGDLCSQISEPTSRKLLSH